jgi:hypothetical protein
VKERSSCAVEESVVEMSTEGRSLQHSETAVCGQGYVKRALEHVKSALEYVNRGETLGL